MSNVPVSQPITEVVSEEAERYIEEASQGKELAFQALMKLAINATTDNDWKDFGGNPYLVGSGSTKIALRFNISLKFDRNANGEPLIMIEEIKKPDGSPIYIYTTVGKAELANGRTFEAIGTASTDDDFLGYENEKDERGKYIKNQQGQTVKVPVPIHEAIQDCKKKSVTNFYGRAILGILGMGGLSWEDLAKYGISKTGKGKVEFGTSKGKKPPLPPPPKLPKDSPAWTWDRNPDDRLIFVREGQHFPQAFIELHRMKPGKNPGVYFRNWDASLWEAIEKQMAIHSGAGEEREPS